MKILRCQLESTFKKYYMSLKNKNQYFSSNSLRMIMIKMFKIVQKQYADAPAPAPGL